MAGTSSYAINLTKQFDSQLLISGQTLGLNSVAQWSRLQRDCNVTATQPPRDFRPAASAIRRMEIALRSSCSRVASQL